MSDPIPAEALNWDGGAVTARAYCVRANNADHMTVVGTNTWIVHEPDSNGALVVDPGPADASHIQAILTACARLGCTVKGIATTHSHFDHVDGIPLLLEAVGSVPVFTRKDGTLPDGDFAPFPSCPRLRVSSLPGHSADCIGLLLVDDKALITGDLIFRDWSTVIVGMHGGNLQDYFGSLDDLEELVEKGAVECFLTGHGRPITDPLPAISAYRAHRLERLDQIRAAVREFGPDAQRIVDGVYGDVDEALKQAALNSTQAQLAYLRVIGDECLI